MKKVGIITHFHNSINYGGVLQAYALCRAIGDMGGSAEQIRFIPGAPEEYSVRKPLLERIGNLFRPAILADFLSSKLEGIRNASIRSRITSRREGFLAFCQKHVPQSNEAYSADQIGQTAMTYDCFITGSDQVWNLDWYQGAYFLDFVPAGKPKISYAASLGMYQLNQLQQQRFQNLLADFHGISVREEDAVTLLQPLTSLPVACTLDPTLLLSAQQWDTVCGPRQIEHPYLFCYFLGENKQLRRLAKQYARNHGLKIVTIPHAKGSYTRTDLNFGDVKVWDASPAEFLSLVKYADCILTNSFHAAVFSGIYEKQYFVFPRKRGDRMVSRIYTLTGYFGSEDHFCDTEEKASLPYLNNAVPISYGQVSQSLQNRKETSFAFLRKNLGQ